MARYERSIYTDPDPKESRRSEEKEERRRADERSLAPYEQKAAEMEKRGKSRGGRGGGGGGGGGMNPIDLERVPGKRPLKMKKGGSVKSSASKRADGIAKKGKTRGKMV
jgi:hypothetical protein